MAESNGTKFKTSSNSLNAPRVRKSRSAGQLILPSFIIGQGPRTTESTKISPNSQNDGKNSYLDSPENYNDSEDTYRNQPKSPRFKTLNDQNIVTGKSVLTGMLHTRPGTHDTSDSLSSPRRTTKSPLKLASTPKKNLLKGKKDTMTFLSKTTENSLDTNKDYESDRTMTSERDGDSDEALSDGEESDPIIRGINCFNQDWKEGIAYLTSKNLIQGDPVGIASFLHTYNDKLSKSHLGDLLAGKEEDTSVLKAFTDTMDFHGEDLLASLRKFLFCFRLPGESQKIHRILTHFADKYQTDNPGVLPTSDAAFLLAYSIIILNTSLHNPAIQAKDKMTKDHFVTGLSDDENRESAWHGKIPGELFNKIYNSILSNELKVNGDPDKKGWNKGINTEAYKLGRAWFCLVGNELSWYKNATQTKLLGKITLEYVQVRDQGDSFIIVSCLPQKIKFITNTKGKTYIMKAVKFEVICENQQMAESWMLAVRKNVTFEVEPTKERSLRQIKIKQSRKQDKKNKLYY